MASIDSESVAIAILWRLSTETVGVNSLGLIKMMQVEILYEMKRHVLVLIESVLPKKFCFSYVYTTFCMCDPTVHAVDAITSIL